MLNRRFLAPYSAAAAAPYTVTYLVIAGGGAGATRTASSDYYLGSGGAGGFVTGSFTAQPGTTYSIDVGNGGARNSDIGSNYVKGDNGDNSTISGGSLVTITATGGGAGGIFDHPVANPNHPSDVNAGAAGGSGGGGTNWNNDTDGYGGSTVAATGTGISTTVQGFAGGDGLAASDAAGAGGGGAGSAGSSPSGTGYKNGGAGGAGKTSSITGVSTYYAAGAGGGKGYSGSGGVTGADGTESELKGKQLLNQLHGQAKWVQCSYNGNIRKNYPMIGYKYDSTRDAFYNDNQPFDSWVFNETTCKWEAPVPYPSNALPHEIWYWDEDSLNWTKD